MTPIRIQEGLWRGERPKRLAELKEMGIRTVLSLESGWWEFLRGKSYSEDELAEALGIEVVHVPMSNLFAPTKSQVETCLGHMLDAARRPLYVHCAFGVDRTGFVCAAFRVKHEGWTVEAAINEWKSLGFHRNWYFWWIGSFRKLME